MLRDAFEFFEGNLNVIVESTNNDPSLTETKKKAKIQEDLSRVRDRILDLKLIFTLLDNDEDAYVIFETLNTRGKDLTLSDLVKSHLSRLLKPTNKGVDVARDKWNKINQLFEDSQADLSVSTFIHHFWLSRYEYITEKKLYKAIRKKIRKDAAKAFLNDLVKESEIYRYLHEPPYKKWGKDELEIRDSLYAMNLFRIKQQLPMVLSVLQQYEDGHLKTKHVRGILAAIENFHFAFTAIVSQRSSGGISFMYALAARELYNANGLSKKAQILAKFKEDKLVPKRPVYAEFEPGFLELRYSTKMTKQKPLVRYILTKIYQSNSEGLPIDHERTTIEHLAAENAVKATGLTDEDIASIGNLILVDKSLNGKLANKDFAEKVKILKQAKVWVDPVILKAKRWGAKEIAERTTLLATESYKRVWKL